MHHVSGFQFMDYLIVFKLCYNKMGKFCGCLLENLFIVVVPALQPMLLHSLSIPPLLAPVTVTLD